MRVGGILFVLMLAAGCIMIWKNVNAQSGGEEQGVYGFVFEPLIGQTPVRLADYKGKVILIVNTASRCGFTGQYDGLEKLYQTYADKGLVIVGVPSDDFGHQEPGGNDEIAHFCQLNYGVTFPMTTKERVVGEEAHPFYKWARQKLGFMAAPKWNFHKYLINRQGELVDYFMSTTKPNDLKLIAAIEKELGPEK